MSRREFPKPVKRDALKRAANRCEGTLADGSRCSAVLTKGKFAFDHVIADALDGPPTLENCAVLCSVCHAEKTDKRDKPAIARAVRLSDLDNGIKTAPTRKLQGRRFEKHPKLRMEKPPALPRRSIYEKVLP